MKQKFLIVFAALAALAGRAPAASDFYVNDSTVVCPPQIPPQVDATNFVNNSYFSINFTNFVFLPSGLFTVQPDYYATADTRNFTNNGMMIANGGFLFDSSPSGNGSRSMAANYVNRGSVLCGSALNTNTFFNLFYPGFSVLHPKYLISATNVSLRSSTNIVGVDGLFSLTGKKVDLNRAFIALEGFDENPDSLFAAIDTVGLSAAYWATSTNVMTPTSNFEFNPPSTPGHLVSLPNNGLGFRRLVLPGANFYLNQYFRGTNLHVEGVFLRNTNSATLNNVYFPFPGYSVVEWLGLHTNQASGLATTNRLYLTDTFGTFATNLLATNFSYYSASGTGMPINYSFTRYNPLVVGLGSPATTTSPAGRFDPSTVTNQFQAFGAVFAPTTVNLTNLPPAGRYVTNLPARVEITADNLDLTMARITGPNYLGLKVTNHVSNANAAKIEVPYSDISLATTNGRLAITNLLYPSVQRFTGEVDLWTGRWTNGIGTSFTVLFVDSRLDPISPAQIQDLTLRSTNLIISDIMNVMRTLMLDAERITLTTNQQPAATTRGEINLLSSAITWSNSLPRLQHLTNNGAISSLNTVFFGGSRTSPFYTSTYNEPYLSFVNTGTVATEGDLIWANFFENSGKFDTGLSLGSIILQSLNASLHGGAFRAPQGDITIAGGSLTISNHVLQAGRFLTLTETNLLTDTGVTSSNKWSARSFSSTVKPSLGDLLGTTVTLTAPAGESVNTWAAEDRSCTAAGFTNNTAVGRLILDGGPGSLFIFTPTALALAFDDLSPQFVPPAGSPVGSGAYHPTNYGRQMLTNGQPANIRSLLSPPYGNNLAVFRATNSLNGDWLLFMERATNSLGAQINWSWNLAFGVLSSNYFTTTNITFVNGVPISTNGMRGTNYTGDNLAAAGPDIVLPGGVPPGGAFGQPYPSSNSVSLTLRSNQAFTNLFTITNQVGVDIYVTNQTVHTFTTDRVTNVVVSLSSPTINDPAEMDVLLVGPHGEKVMLMAGAGALNTSRKAIYVDYLELRNSTTNRDAGGNFTGLQVDPNMKIYFAQAMANGVSIAEKLDQQNGGRFCWISDYAGFYSGTNVVYPDGTTNYFNAALVGSCNLDSDGDGLVNCADTTPILRPQDLGLSVSLVTSPSLKALVSWQTGPFAANFVYYKTNTGSANWQLLTNFASGPLGGRVSIAEPVNPTRPRYYRVRVDAHQP